METLTSLRAAGIFFCFLPDGILCKTDDKALEGDLWFPGDPILGEFWWSKEIKYTYEADGSYSVIQLNSSQ